MSKSGRRAHVKRAKVLRDRAPSGSNLDWGANSVCRWELVFLHKAGRGAVRWANLRLANAIRSAYRG